MSARRLLTAAALCAMSVACESTELTQVVVVVDSDTDQFERVQIGFEGLSRTEPVDVDLREQPLPRRITLVHDGGPLGPFAVTVSAFAAGADEPMLVEPRRQLFFEGGRARMLKIDLLKDCARLCDDGQACLAGNAGPTCVSSSSSAARQLHDWDGVIDPLRARDDNPGKAGSAAGSGGSSGTAGTAGGGPGVLEPPMPALAFPYEPSNFDPRDPVIGDDRAAVVLDCHREVVFDSASMSFSDLCGEEPFATVIEQREGGEAALLVMDTLSIKAGTTLRLVGTRPVILAVYGDAQILGAIDASAVGDSPGAGGNVDCGDAAGSDGMAAEDLDSSSGSGTDGEGTSGASGGGGGGFGTVGARGGGSINTPSANGGATLGSAMLAPLRGGCPGGHGGLGNDASAAPGGAGGGAVQISAAGRLDVVGSIAANGGGGGANETLRAGGGGGGSGGAVLLEGREVAIDSAAIVVANGGGGGGGNATAGEGRASAGADGARSIAPAVGGMGPNSGGDGGFGAARTAGAADGEDAEESLISDDYGAGGGGGGGAGRIRVHQGSACVSSGKFSPALENECGACADCVDLPSPDCQLLAFDSRTYVHCEEPLSWSDAQARCASVGMSLAQVEDASEQAFLLELIADDTWLGARDSLDGEWSWEPSGTAFWSEELDEPVDGAYADWATGQPDVDPEQDCLAESGSGWIDLDCGDEAPYLCEL